MLISVTADKEKVFTAVEQGSGKNVVKVFSLMKPNKRAIVRE